MSYEGKGVQSASGAEEPPTWDSPMIGIWSQLHVTWDPWGTHSSRDCLKRCLTASGVTKSDYTQCDFWQVRPSSSAKGQNLIKQSDNLAFPWAQSPYTVPLILIVLRTTSPWSLDHRGRSLQVPVMSLEDLLGKIHIRIRPWNWADRSSYIFVPKYII